MQLKLSWTFYHAHSALGPVMDSVRLSPLLLLFCSCLGLPSWHFPHWLCLPLVLSWSLRLDSWSQLARSGSSLPSVVTRALAGVLMVVICHFAANQGQAMHPLELILQLSCLRTVLFGFKNSRQQRTTKTLTGLFCSQITLPDPFSAIPSCIPGEKASLGDSLHLLCSSECSCRLRHDIQTAARRMLFPIAPLYSLAFYVAWGRKSSNCFMGKGKFWSLKLKSSTQWIKVPKWDLQGSLSPLLGSVFFCPGFSFKRAFLLWGHAGRDTFSLHILSMLQF